MTRFVILLGLFFFAGCAHTEPTSCDGRDKRPINSGKWDEQMSLGACGSREVRP